MDVETFYNSIIAVIFVGEGKTVVGTGPCGRIPPADVEVAAEIVKHTRPNDADPTPVTAAPPKFFVAALPLIPRSTMVPFTTMQAAVLKNMVESLLVPTFRIGYPINSDTIDAIYDMVNCG
ncbi:hypothetical protein TB2_007611 [Malus domestica]